VGFFDWLRRRGPNRDEEAAEREEFGGPDPGEAELKRDEAIAWPGAGPAAEVAADDLKDEEPPRPYRE
jgi:hypothetical protein